MWTRRALLLALLLVHLACTATSHVVSVKPDVLHYDSCQAKNHMVEYLRSNGVLIHQYPVKTSKYCKKEWSVFGNCCEISSLRTVIKKKIYLNNFALTDVQKEIGAIHPRIVEFRQSYKSQNHTANQSVGTTSNGISFSTSHAGHTPVRSEQEELAIERYLDSLEKEIQLKTPSRQQSQQDCVNTINNVISKSACSLCSSRSDSFFSSEGKLRISEQNCRAVLTNCSDAWSGMVELVKEVSNYTTNVRLLVGYNDADGSMEEKGFTMNLDSFIKHRHLLPILKNCQKGQLASCSFKEVSTLCEQFIHIQSPTYIESSQSQLNSLFGELTSVEVNYNVSLANYTLLQERIQLLDKSFPETEQRNNQYYKNKKHYTCRLTQVIRDLRIGWMSIKQISSLFGGLIKSTSDKKVKKSIANSRDSLKSVNSRTNKLLLAVHRFQHAHLRKLLTADSTAIKDEILESLYRSWSLSTSYLEELLFPVSVGHPRHPKITEAMLKANERETEFLTNKNISRDGKTMHRLFYNYLRRLISVGVSAKSPQKPNKSTPAKLPTSKMGRKLDFLLLHGSESSNGEVGFTDTCVANDSFCSMTDSCSEVSQEVDGICDDETCSQEHDTMYRDTHDSTHLVESTSFDSP